MNLLDILIRVERDIAIYENVDDELVKEISIDISIEDLKKIIIPNENDIEFYDGYVLNEAQLNFLIDKCSLSITPDFINYTYILIAGGIYDWDKLKK